MCFASQLVVGGASRSRNWIDRRLSDQGHRHLAIANVEIACPCAVPTQCLMCIEELPHVPPFGKISGQLLNLVAVAGRRVSRL